jgi:hypothetical protein
MHRHQLTRFLVGQGLEDNPVHYAEYGRGHANPQGEGENHHGREDRAAAEASEGLPGVGPEILNQADAPGPLPASAGANPSLMSFLTSISMWKAISSSISRSMRPGAKVALSLNQTFEIQRMTGLLNPEP